MNITHIDKIVIVFNSKEIVETVSKVHKDKYWILELKQISEDTYRIIGEKIVSNQEDKENE